MPLDPHSVSACASLPWPEALAGVAGRAAPAGVNSNSADGSPPTDQPDTPGGGASSPGTHLTPDGLRAQALACGRLANQALAEGDHAEVGRLVERARQLVLLALEAEAEAARR